MNAGFYSAIKLWRHAVSRTEERRARRNLSPHAPARVARALWSNRYAAQNGGSMDFWDSLREPQQQLCREIAEQIRAAPMDER